MRDTIWVLTPSEIERTAIEGTFPTEVTLLSTGIGALASLHTLWQRYCEERVAPKVIIGLGIAGTFRQTWAIPSVVYVCEEIWGDLGRRYVRRFLPASERLTRGFPRRWVAPPAPLPVSEGIGLTLHTVSATPAEARYWKRAYPDADIETQENAAYFLFGSALGVPVYVFRVLSNRVGQRRWAKEAALHLLHTFTMVHVVPLCERLMAAH